MVQDSLESGVVPTEQPHESMPAGVAAHLNVAEVLESIADAFFTLDRAFCFTYLNGAAERLLLRPRALLLGRCIWDEFAESAGSALFDELHRAATQRVTVEFEDFYTPLGSWFSVRAHPIPDGLAVYLHDVTHTKQTAEMVRRFKAMADHANDIYLVADEQARLVYANQRACVQLGYTEAELRQRSVPDIDAFYDQARYAELVKDLAEGTYRPPFESTLRRKDGTTFPVEVNVTLMEFGGQLYLFGIGRDLTDRKRAEELRRILTDNATAALFMLDAQGRCTFMNPAAEQMTGYRLDELRGKVLHDLLQQTPQGALALAGAPLVAPWSAESKAWPPEGVFHRQDGRFVPVACVASPIIESDILMGTVLEVRDISQEKRNEALLAGQNRVLELMVRGEPLSEVLEALCQIIEGQARGWLIASVLLLDEDGRRLRPVAGQRSPAVWTRAIEGLEVGPAAGSCGTAAFRGERVIVADIARDPLWVPFRELAISHGLRACWSTPIFSSQGKVLGTFAVYYDVPRAPTPGEQRLVDLLARTAGIAIERRQAEDTLRRQKCQLEEANRHKDEFLAMLAHELRNPLAPVRNSLHLLRLEANRSAAVAEVGGMMERQVEHLVRLVDDLLDVSRLMQGKIQLRKEAVAIAEVVRRAVETAQPVMDAQGHHLEVALPAEPVWVEGDLMRLTQVVWNLLTNAAKYTERAGRVWLSVEHAGSMVVLRVRDNGMGISPELLPRIFDLFTQADRSLARSQGGLGIGLTLVRRLVEMHDGRVEARSDGPGKGSAFAIHLPALFAPPPREAEPECPAPAPRGSSRRVLIVDDNVDAARSLALLARVWGHEVEVAHDGHSALRVTRAFRPDILLLDIGLPGLTGYEVAEELQKEPERESYVVVAVTGYGQDEDRRRVRAAGFDHHLVKPVDPPALERLLAEVHKPS